MRQVEHLEKNMALSSYNVKQQLAAQFQELLTRRTIPFSLLKTYITANQAINDVQQVITAELNKLAKEEIKDSKTMLKQKALQNQRIQDQQTNRTDEQENDRDELTRQANIRDQISITGQQQRTILELSLVEQRIAQRKAQEAQTQLHSHPSESATNTQHHEHPSQSTSNTHQHGHPSTQPAIIDPEEQYARDLNYQLAGYSLQLSKIKEELHQLRIKDQHRRERRMQRDKRQEAQLYLAQNPNDERISEALTVYNYQGLVSEMEREQQKIISERTRLTNKAQAENHPCFLEELETRLGTLGHSLQEQEAIQTVLNHNKQYQVYKMEVNRSQNQLKQTKSLISSTRERLHKATQQIELLKQANPNLDTINSELTTKNIQLALAHTENTQEKDKYSLPAWILAGLAVVSSIPLALALGGIITVNIAPALFYILISLIPALSLTTSVGLGITSLVYGLRASSNSEELTKNTNSIAANKAQMIQNVADLAELEKSSIPSYRQTIELESQNQIQQEALLEENKRLAQLALQQAESIEPGKALYPVLPVQFNSPPPSYDASNRNAFFAVVPYQGIGPMPAPSAPPIEDMEGYNGYSYH